MCFIKVCFEENLVSQILQLKGFFHELLLCAHSFSSKTFLTNVKLESKMASFLHELMLYDCSVLLKRAGSSWFCLNSANKTRDIKGVFSVIFSTFFNSVKKNQNVLGGFFWRSSTFFNVKEDPGFFKRFFCQFLAHFSIL